MKLFLGEGRHYFYSAAPYNFMGIHVDMPWQKDKGMKAWETVIAARELLSYSFRKGTDGNYDIDFTTPRKGQPQLHCYDSGNLDDYMLEIKKRPMDISHEVLLTGYVRAYEDSFDFSISVSHIVMDGSVMVSFIQEFMQVYRGEVDSLEPCGYVDNADVLFKEHDMVLGKSDASAVAALNQAWEQRYPELSVSKEQTERILLHENTTEPFAFLRTPLLSGEEFVSFRRKAKEKGLTIGDCLIAAIMKAFPIGSYQIATDARFKLGLNKRALGTVASSIPLPSDMTPEEIHTAIQEKKEHSYATLLKSCYIKAEIFDASYLAAIGEFMDPILVDFKNCMNICQNDFATISNMRAIDFGEHVTSSWALPCRMAKNSITMGIISTADILSLAVGYGTSRYTTRQVQEGMKQVREYVLAI